MKKILDACCGSRMFWLDHLSVDENGWMDAIPVQDGDADTYTGQTKVIEYSAFEKSQARVKKLETALREVKECVNPDSLILDIVQEALGDKND